MKRGIVSVAVAALALVLLGCSGGGQPGPAPKASGKPEPKAAPAKVAKADPAADAHSNATEPAGKTEPAKAEPVASEPPKAEPPKVDPPKAEPPKADPKADPKEAKGEVVAVVDGEKITRAEFDAFIAKATGGRTIPASQRAQAERQILDMNVNQKLLKKFINAQNIEIDEETLFDAKLRTYVQNMPGADNLHARHILIKVAEGGAAGPKNDAEALALAKSIRKELDGGGDFAELAKKHSACPSKSKVGDLGEFTAERMVKPFSDAVVALKVNEISQPVKTEFGYHIIQRLAAAAGPAGPEQMQANFQKLLLDLRNKAKIENKLPAAPASAPGLPGLPGLPGGEDEE
jgi:peptidyl-prolyl cis-trans isomerase C